MMQSIGYELIKKEGLEEGYKRGFQEGLEEGLEQGLEQGHEQGYRDGLLAAIALGLELKFGVEGLKLMPEIKGIRDVGILEIVEQAIRTAQRPEELRELYRP